VSQQAAFRDRAAAQLADGLDRLAQKVAPYGELQSKLPPETWAAREIEDLLSDDRELAGKTARTVLSLVALPADQQLVDELGIPPEGWWTSPLGMVCSIALSMDRKDQSVTVAQAQTVLGISRARVYQLLDAGKLERLDKGISFASVMRRLRAMWRDREGE